MPGQELPTRESLSSALKVSEGSIMAAQYLAAQLEKSIVKGKLLDKGGRELLAEVQRHAKYVEYNLSPLSKSWEGESPIVDPNKNLQGHLAKEAVDSIPANNDNSPKRAIDFQYAVADKKPCLAVFTEDGKPLESDESKLFNELFTTWLVKNDLSSKKGFLYQRDAAGNETPVSAEQFKAKLEDPVKGFGASQGFGGELAKKGFELDCMEREYPGVTKQQQQTVKQEEPEQTSTQDVEPTQPEPEHDDDYTPGMQ